MAFIDETAVTVALPTIQSALGAPAVHTQWEGAIGSSSEINTTARPQRAQNNPG